MYTSEFTPQRGQPRPLTDPPEENEWSGEIKGDVDKVLAACACTRLPGVAGYEVMFALPQVEHDKLSDLKTGERGGTLVLTCEHGTLTVEY